MAWLTAVVRAAVLGGGVMVVQAASGGSAPLSIEGRWGGDQVQLVFDRQGGRLQTDCASGTIAGPVHLSDLGSFSAAGTFELHQPGPQRADEGAAPAAARFVGEVKDGVMRLSVTPHGAAAPLSFQLRKGLASKLVRCL